MAKKQPAAAPKPDPNPVPAPTPAPEPSPGGALEGAQPPADAPQPGAQASSDTPLPEQDAGTEKGLGDAPAPAGDIAQPAADLKPESEPEPEPEPEQPAPDLDDYIATHEKGAQAVDLVVTAIRHPDAKPGHHPGVYSGFPITVGPLQATYSDGSKH